MIQLKNQKLIRGICDKTPHSIVSGDKKNQKKKSKAQTITTTTIN